MSFSFGVKMRITTAYHPQSNGLDERTNQTLKSQFCLVCVHAKYWTGLLSTCIITLIGCIIMILYSSIFRSLSKLWQWYLFGGTDITREMCKLHESGCWPYMQCQSWLTWVTVWRACGALLVIFVMADYAAEIEVWSDRKAKQAQSVFPSVTTQKFPTTCSSWA